MRSAAGARPAFHHDSRAHEATVDVFRWPVVGPILRWRHARTAFQLVLLAAAALLVLHGLLGPEFAPANLATVATWIHYRGLLVIALLAAGNFFCMGCPLVRVRDWGRRIRKPSRHWPRVLRTKWPAIALFAAVLFCYELFDLWSLPKATAWLILGYFAAALAVDLVFTGATFCKHLCPIGQFNFAAATLSPLELRVREPDRCRSCGTFDCIKGRRTPVAQRGCELRLFQPTKVGNLDCTFCMDCVQACPHDNVALAARLPGLELIRDERRSSIGKLSARSDLAALAVLFTFGALLNAFAMTVPAGQLQAFLARLTGVQSGAFLLVLLFAAALIGAPLVLMGAASWLTRLAVPNRSRSIAGIAVRYAYALVPFGLSVWLAHYGFHFLTGALTIVPVLQSAVADLLGFPALGEPLWGWTGMRPGAVFPIEVGFILLGALASLALAYAVSERDGANASRATLPWAALVAALAAGALWTLTQPMEMRGMSGMGMEGGPGMMHGAGGTHRSP